MSELRSTGSCLVRLGLLLGLIAGVGFFLFVVAILFRIGLSYKEAGLIYKGLWISVGISVGSIILGIISEISSNKKKQNKE